MEQKRTSQASANNLYQRGARPKVHHRNSGFILFYAFWVLTGITISIAVVVKQYSKSGQATQTQIQTVIQQRQLLAVMDYVLQNSYQITVKNDERYQALQQQQKDTELQKIQQMAKQLAEQVGRTVNFNNTSDTVATAGSEEQLIPGKYQIQAQPYILELAGENYQINILPGNILPNLTKLTTKVLAIYLKNIGFTKNNAEKLAAVISDWQDKDQNTQENGAESGSGKYQQSYHPANKPLRSWQELYALKDVNIVEIKKLQQYTVLKGSQIKLSKKYTEPKIIAALADVPEKIVQQWLHGSAEKSLLFDQQKQAIEKIISKDNDKEIWQISIFHQQQGIKLRFNWQQKEIINWAFFSK